MVKLAISKFPIAPFRATHTLSGVVHPLLDWASKPTLLPVLSRNPNLLSVSDDEDFDEGDESSGSDAEGGEEGGGGGVVSGGGVD